MGRFGLDARFVKKDEHGEYTQWPEPLQIDDTSAEPLISTAVARSESFLREALS